jgi:hypothetical protein
MLTAHAAGQAGTRRCGAAACAQPPVGVACCDSAAARPRTRPLPHHAQAIHGCVRWRACRHSGVCTHACESGTAMQRTRLSTDRHARTDARTPTPTTTTTATKTKTITAHANPASQRGRPIGATVTRWGCMLVQVPAMGDSISEGTIAVWHKKVGDQVMLY